MKPIITIVTPHYNMSNTLLNSVLSVPETTSDYIEHIIIDDCSSPQEYREAKKICELRKNIKFLKNRKNVGPVHTMNKGAKFALANHLIFLSADDALEPNFIRYILPFLKKDCTIPLILGQISIKNKKRSRIIANQNLQEIKRIKPPARELIAGIRMLIHGQAIVNKKLFLKHGGYSKSLEWNADLFLHSKIATEYGALLVPKVCGYFTKNFSSYGNSKKYPEQEATLRFLVERLSEPENKLLKEFYIKSGTLGKEPYSLKYFLANKLWEYINWKFMWISILYKSRRVVTRII